MGQICFSLLTESFDTQILFFEGIVAFFFFSLLNKKQIVWELFMAHFVCFQQMENDYKWYCFLMIYSGYSQMTGLNKSISIIFCCQQPKALISWSPLSSKKPFSAYFSLLPFPDYQNNFMSFTFINFSPLSWVWGWEWNGQTQKKRNKKGLILFCFCFFENWYNKCFFSHYILQVDSCFFTQYWTEP